MLGRAPSDRRSVSQPPLTGIEGVARCHCAGAVAAAVFGCLECGAPCCSACAITLESVAYCLGCATALLDATVILQSGSFELY
jgi:hypothetical protein